MNPAALRALLEGLPIAGTVALPVTNDDALDLLDRPLIAAAVLVPIIHGPAPGVLLTLLAWLAGALIFAYYLQTFANYTATYAGLASVMIVLVFLYMIGVIFIIGAEMNAALMKFRVRRMIARNYYGLDDTKASEPDPAPDIRH